MAKAPSPATIAIIKATAPALREHGLAITTRMYDRLFADEAMRAMFDTAAIDSGDQPRRLAVAILSYAENIDRLDALAGPVERIVARHVDVGVRADHYPLVAEALIPAIRDVLGEAATDSVLSAWAEAYWYLADILIGLEAQDSERRAA